MEMAMSGKLGVNYWWVAPVSSQAAFGRMRDKVSESPILRDKTSTYAARVGQKIIFPIRLMQLAQYYWPLTADGAPKFRAVEARDRSGQPILDKDGKPTFNQVPVGDVEKFMEIAGALSLTSFRLARFHSPTLQAIAVAQQQSSTTSEPIHYEVHIHNARGEHIRTTIDGEVVEEPDMKLIESDRTDGPDA
jgi:hypothetical protein